MCSHLHEAREVIVEYLRAQVIRNGFRRTRKMTVCKAIFGDRVRVRVRVRVRRVLWV